MSYQLHAVAFSQTLECEASVRTGFAMYSLACSPDGQFIAASGHRGYVIVFKYMQSPAPNQPQSSSCDSTAKPALVHVVTLKLGDRLAGYVRFGCVAGKQRLMVTCRSSKCTIRLFNIPGLSSNSHDNASTPQQQQHDSSATGGNDDGLQFVATGLRDQTFHNGSVEPALLHAALSQQHNAPAMLQAAVVR